MDTKRMATVALVIPLLLALAGIASVGWGQEPAPQQAASPEAPLGAAFTYQGRLMHDDGQPVDDFCDFEFSLYASDSSATPIDVLPLDNVGVTEGLFTVHLDYGLAPFAGEERWLGIAVACPAGSGAWTSLGDRQPLTATPYALHALTTAWDGLAGVPPGFADGIDDNTLYIPGEGLTLVTDEIFALLPGYQLPQECDDGQVTKWEDLIGRWVCGDDDNTLYTPGEGLTLVPDDTFALLPGYQLPQVCTGGQVAKWEDGSSSWVCGDDNVGGGAEAWLLSGNAGTQPGVDVLGTTDPVSLTLVVDGAPALRLEFTGLAPNLVGGALVNSVTPGAWAATVGGGGDPVEPNQVSDKYGTVGGGSGNLAGNGDDLPQSHPWSTVGGGRANSASGGYATVGGGYYNQALGNYATIAGGGPSDIGYPDTTNNRVTDSYGTIGGGGNNLAGDDDGDVTNARYATVGGGWGNTASGVDATVGGGYANEATGDEAAIGGGVGNDATGYAAAVAGGLGNQATAAFATIAGGGRSNVADSSTANLVTDNYGTIGGGADNQAGDGDSDPTSAIYATVGGGYGNTASEWYATIGGGSGNTAVWYATVGGGQDNAASNALSTIGGGLTNSASDWYTTVGGGYGNTASDNSAAVGGGAFNSASGIAATVSGGQSNTAYGGRASVGGGWGNLASGANATISGGYTNVLSGTAASIGGGYSNTITCDYGAVGGGAENQLSPSPFDYHPDYATIAGGHGNTVTGWSGNMSSWGYGAAIGGGEGNTVGEAYGTIGGGYDNTVNGDASTIGGGGDNTIDGDSWYSTIGGGEENTIEYTAFHATIPGGWKNTARGHTSFAAGYRALAQHEGAFVWSDSSATTDFASERIDQFRARATGGVRFDVNASEWVNIYSQVAHATTVLIDTSTGAYLTSGGAWTNNSDRNAKENLAPVDPQQVLDRLAQIPISTWNYNAEDPSVRHMGPMAQDFSAAFGLGGDDKAIGTIDADGVALAAIQGLYGLVEEKEAEMAALQDEVVILREQNADLEARLTALERAAGGGQPQSRLPLLWLLAGGLLLAGGTVSGWQRLSGGGR